MPHWARIICKDIDSFQMPSCALPESSRESRDSFWLVWSWPVPRGWSFLFSAGSEARPHHQGTLCSVPSQSRTRLLSSLHPWSSTLAGNCQQYRYRGLTSVVKWGLCTALLRPCSSLSLSEIILCTDPPQAVPAHWPFQGPFFIWQQLSMHPVVPIHPWNPGR